MNIQTEYVLLYTKVYCNIELISTFKYSTFKVISYGKNKSIYFCCLKRKTIEINSILGFINQNNKIEYKEQYKLENKQQNILYIKQFRYLNLLRNFSKHCKINFKFIDLTISPNPYDNDTNNANKHLTKIGFLNTVIEETKILKKSYKFFSDIYLVENDFYYNHTKFDFYLYLK